MTDLQPRDIVAETVELMMYLFKHEFKIELSNSQKYLLIVRIQDLVRDVLDEH